MMRRLLENCLSELSQWGEVDIAYPFFDAYWDPQERRWPYLLQQDRDICGFALINAWSPSGKGTDLAMAEFYIAPHARRSGIGRDAAAKIFLMHSGQWELGIISRNEPAQRFWPKMIAEVGARDVERIDADGETIYRFKTG
ncbi:GNAT family N-acetyltransferase [Kaistia soli]|nr:GNAT family N-acetyltransferase [Kaistia soli]